jgi:hypothetical protein
MDLMLRPLNAWRKILWYPMDKRESSPVGLDVVAEIVVAASAENRTTVILPVTSHNASIQWRLQPISGPGLLL